MTIAIILPSIGDYRQEFFEYLLSRNNGGIEIYTGGSYFEPSFITRVNFGSHLHKLKNSYLFGRSLLWQSGMWKQALDADILILLLNPRILSNWVILILRKVLGRKSILWGHAWPRKGRKSLSDRIRNLYRRLSTCLLVYTKTEKEQLSERMPRASIFVAPNSLYSKSKLVKISTNPSPKNFIYVGRLAKDKKPEILIEAFANARRQIPGTSRLVIVGDGPLLATLIHLANRFSISQFVDFPGHVSDFDTLMKLYSGCIASLSPGYVGLSIIQSHWFGVPMIIANSEPHAPEIEIARDGINCVFFESDSSLSLTEAINSIWRNREYWVGQRTKISEYCAENYNLELMVEGTLEAIADARKSLTGSADQ